MWLLGSLINIVSNAIFLAFCGFAFVFIVGVFVQLFS